MLSTSSSRSSVWVSRRCFFTRFGPRIELVCLFVSKVVSQIVGQCFRAGLIVCIQPRQCVLLFFAVASASATAAAAVLRQGESPAGASPSAAAPGASAAWSAVWSAACPVAWPEIWPEGWPDVWPDVWRDSCASACLAAGAMFCRGARSAGLSEIFGRGLSHGGGHGRGYCGGRSRCRALGQSLL